MMEVLLWLWWMIRLDRKRYAVGGLESRRNSKPFRPGKATQTCPPKECSYSQLNQDHQCLVMTAKCVSFVLPTSGYNRKHFPPSRSGLTNSMDSIQHCLPTRRHRNTLVVVIIPWDPLFDFNRAIGDPYQRQYCQLKKLY